MASCDYCGSIILFGGVREGDFRFCNDSCQPEGALLSVLSQIPEDLLAQQVKEVHWGSCPKCRGHGPIDVQTSYRVWSAILFSSWKSRPQVCCRSCGLKAKVVDALFSGVFGWWGVPWGVVMTTVQITRNFAGLLSAPHPYEPSAQLRKLVALTLAAQVVQTTTAEPVES